MLLNEFLFIYISILLGLVLSTVCLIFFGYNWGPLPHLYIKLIKFIQSFYPKNYPLNENTLWPGIIKQCDLSMLQKHYNDSCCSFYFSEMPILNVFDICTDAFKAGFEAVIQDQLGSAINPVPSYCSTLLEHPGRSPFPDEKLRISRLHIFGYFIALIFRYGILLPIRLSFMIIAILFTATMIVTIHFINMTDEQKTRTAVIICRIFCAGIGLVAKYHNRQYKPKKRGIAVANHLSTNDVQILCADIDPNDDYCFTITGQRHNGVLCFIENIADKLIPTLWLDRDNIADRKRFKDDVIQTIKANGPVLLFPEGVCTNNTRVLRFRKAIFDDNIVIHPIAIRQYACFGDSFWSEPKFLYYLKRLFTSWAIVYDVTYLKPHQKQPDESNQDFAQRVQTAIAQTLNTESIPLDGRLWYLESEQQRLKMVQMKNLAKRFEDLINEQTGHNRSVQMKSQKLLNGNVPSLVFTTVSTNEVSLT